MNGEIYLLTDLFNSYLVPRYLVVAIYMNIMEDMKIKPMVTKMCKCKYSKSSNVLLFPFMLTGVGI